MSGIHMIPCGVLIIPCSMLKLMDNPIWADSKNECLFSVWKVKANQQIMIL